MLLFEGRCLEIPYLFLHYQLSWIEAPHNFTLIMPFLCTHFYPWGAVPSKKAQALAKLFAKGILIISAPGFPRWKWDQKDLSSEC